MSGIPHYAMLGEPATGAPSRQWLRAGPLSVLIDGPMLRYVRLGPHELVRCVYAAVRDHNWDTVPPRIIAMATSVTTDQFDVSFEVECQAPGIDFRWHGHISGLPDGTLTFDFDGLARVPFRKNRIGLCILHPASSAGAACEVGHSSGAVERSSFPLHIAPHQPFMDIRSMAHEVAPGLWAEVALEGDIFETEDQRNWTDASYKTYSTPLALPYPVEISAGERIHQRFTLTLRGPVPALPPKSAALTFDTSGPALPLPRLGLGMASHGQPLDAASLHALRALKLDHLRLDLPLSWPGWRDHLAQATAQAHALGCSLEIALFLASDGHDEVAALRQAVDELHPPVVRWLIFHQGEKSTGADRLRMARIHLEDAVPGATFGAGTNAYFTEINRERPPMDLADLLTYSLNPQVHAFDNLSLVETLATQATTLTSARQFAAGKPVVVSPITLRPRFNPNATGPEREPEAGELPAAVDVRQLSLFAAGWTLGSLKYLTLGGAASATYYETSGWRGVLETSTGSLEPDRFPSQPGMLFPLYHVFAAVADLGATHAVPGHSSDPLTIEGLTLYAGTRRRLLLANLTSVAQDVDVTGTSSRLHVHLQPYALESVNWAEA